MARDWQGGDVAMVKTDAQREVRAMWSADCKENGEGPHPVSGHWHDANGRYFPPAGGGRPLVIIDPEDREQILALANAYMSNLGNGIDAALQAALRDLADPKPPRPEEPTGLGAVVVDAKGTRWVRSEIAAKYEWSRAGITPVTSGQHQRWSKIDAIEVLSQGVTP